VDFAVAVSVVAIWALLDQGAYLLTILFRNGTRYVRGGVPHEPVVVGFLGVVFAGKTPPIRFDALTPRYVEADKSASAIHAAQRHTTLYTLHEILLFCVCPGAFLWLIMYTLQNPVKCDAYSRARAWESLKLLSPNAQEIQGVRLRLNHSLPD
jgi:hypothetical protein